MFEVMEWGHNLDLTIYSNYQPAEAPWIRENGKECHSQKGQFGQLEAHSPLEFSQAVTKFAPSIYFVYLPENENVVELEDTSMARKIEQTLKIHKLERKCSQNGDT